MAVKAILKSKINDELKQIFLYTNTDNVYLYEDGKQITLTEKLADIIASVEDTTATDESIDDKIKDAIADLVGTAPESLDTLKELADAITDNKDLIDALNDSILNKVDKEDEKELISTELLEKLTEIDFENLGNNDDIPVITVDENEPDSMKVGDLWFQVIGTIDDLVLE